MRVSSKNHRPVLLHKVLEYLDVRKGEKYIDATVGMGGHALEIVKQGGIVLGIDRDRESLKKSKTVAQNLILAHGNFRDIKKIAVKKGFTKVAGILFDLGLSSWQIEKSGRGFSYMRNEPLDMRLNVNDEATAEDILNRSSRDKLYELFTKFGEEERSRRIADALIRARPLKTTYDLVDVVRSVVGVGRRSTGVIARIFQAIRIAVNHELESFRIALPCAQTLLAQNSKLLIISFHSLEDRIVKHTFTGWERRNLGKVLTKKPITPSQSEIQQNIRARSAKLRVFTKR